MTIVDWRGVDSRALALVFARERARWLVELGWETRESWLHVERARTTWGLPGLAALDDGGRVRGLTFFHDNRGRYDIGGVFAESGAVREALVDAALAVCLDAGAEDISAFVYTANQPVGDQLAARGFACEQVDYLSRLLTAGSPTDTDDRHGSLAIRGWQPGDADAVAALLAASYEPEAARRFVREATHSGWHHYLETLVQHHACGQVMPAVSRIAVSGDTVMGAVIATDLGPGTAHLAQVAVRPEWRRSGLAGALIDQSIALARQGGAVRMTLLVSASNAGAQALYRQRGFSPAGTFLAATREGSPRVVAQAS